MEESGGKVALERLPTQTERAALERRYQELRKVLRPINEAVADKERASQAIAAMLSNWSLHATMRGVDPQVATANFLTHLGEYPLFAVVEACEQKRKGSDPHPPSCGEVGTIARARWETVQAEGDRLVKVLNCGRTITRQVSEAERSRVGELLSGLAKTLSVTDELDAAMKQRVVDRSRKSTEDSILREYKQLGIEPQFGPFGIISPALLRTIGKLEPEKPRKGKDR